MISFQLLSRRKIPNKGINYFKWTNEKLMSSFDKTLDDYVWERSPVDINAFYVNSWNRLVLPVGMFNEPFYSADRPAALNFATLGFVVGHEVSHGFDNTGRKHGNNGSLFDWWTKNATDEFLKRTQCFVNQYSDYVYEETNVNGLHTLSENIADNGGLRTALKAFDIHVAKYGSNSRSRLPDAMEKYSSKQLFFISFANMWCNKIRHSYKSVIVNGVHAPNKYRVLGTLQNSCEFSQIFNCKSKQSNSNKCTIW